MPLSRSCLSLVLVALCGLTGRAAVPVPAGLAPGDVYHLVFNSSTFINGLSSDIATYNSHVQAAADAAEIGASSGVTWRAIASTASIDARVNAVVGANTPVYNTRAGQLEKVADGFSDMWDGSLDGFAAYDERGTFQPVDAWTGSTVSGLRASGSTLGHASGSAWCGRPTFSNGQWIAFFEPSTTAFLSVYGLSEAITVTDADFDQNGAIEGIDFLRWQRGVGGSGGFATGDADGSGVVDGADLGVWQKSYGAASATLSVVAAVPEPRVWPILLIAGAITTSVRTARRRSVPRGRP